MLNSLGALKQGCFSGDLGLCEAFKTTHEALQEGKHGLKKAFKTTLETAPLYSPIFSLKKTLKQKADRNPY